MKMVIGQERDSYGFKYKQSVGINSLEYKQKVP